MTEESPSPKKPIPPPLSTPISNANPTIRRVTTIDESLQPRRRRISPTAAASATMPESAPLSNNPRVRRRSSNFSDLSEVRRSFQSSTDDLLLPKPRMGDGREDGQGGESSHWDSAPLAFALLPAIGGMVFTNGSSVVTDVMLLGLAAVFLNWSVRVPWTWYHSAQAVRKREEYNNDVILEESEDENGLSLSQTTLDNVPEDQVQDQPAAAKAKFPSMKPQLPAHEAAATELYRHEVLALLSCFVFPLMGAYMLHTIRSQLTRPSEGLVSNYNLTIFMLASEVRPLAHLVKLIQARTLHLQRVVNSDPYAEVRGAAASEVKDLVRRLELLETRNALLESSPTTITTEPTMNGKQTSSLLTLEVRKTIQPDLDALNRAVRRYEKRATLQAFQTESRLQDLESRLNDAIALAAAAAKNDYHRGFTGIILEWIATAIVLPLQAFGVLASLPFKMMVAVINFGKTRFLGQQPVDRKKKGVNGKVAMNGRYVERGQSRVLKR